MIGGFVVPARTNCPNFAGALCAYRGYGVQVDAAGLLVGSATLADRSIEIKLKRKTTSESAERLDRHARGGLGEVASRIARWALDNRATVQGAEPVLPGALDDRASDNWRPLIAVADAAGVSASSARRPGVSSPPQHRQQQQQRHDQQD